MDSPKVLRKLGKSVTTLYVLGDRWEVLGSGSGFAVSDTLMVTAEHVCSATDYEARIAIRNPSGTLVLMTPVKRDSLGDVCLLRGDHSLNPLKVSSRDVQLGDHIWIYGSPLGVDGIVTSGYAGKMMWLSSGVPRRALSIQAFGGNSGSPVLNEDGLAIGVLVSGHMQYTQLTFATPHENLVDILE